MPFVTLNPAPIALTNWQLAMVLWPFVVLTLGLMALIVFWPQVSVVVVRLRGAVVGLFRGRTTQDGESNGADRQ